MAVPVHIPICSEQGFFLPSVHWQQPFCLSRVESPGNLSLYFHDGWGCGTLNQTFVGMCISAFENCLSFHQPTFWWGDLSEVIICSSLFLVSIPSLPCTCRSISCFVVSPHCADCYLCCAEPFNFTASHWWVLGNVSCAVGVILIKSCLYLYLDEFCLDGFL